MHYYYYAKPSKKTKLIAACKQVIIELILVAVGVLAGIGLILYSLPSEAAEYEGYEFSSSTMSTYSQESADHADAVNAEAEQQMYDELAALVADYATGNDLEPAGSKPPPPLEFYTGAWSIHLGEEADNENHRLVAFSYGNVMFSSFRNSHDVDSWAATYLLRYEPWEYIELGTQLGIVHGYTDEQIEPMPCWDGVCLAVIPQIAYTQYKVQPVIMVVGRAVAFSIRWRFH